MTDNLPAVPSSANNLEALAQAHEGEALALMVETMRDGTVKRDIRLKAAEALLDRARGKPRQPTQRDPNRRTQKAVQMSVETLLKIVQGATARVEHQDATRAQAKILEGEFVPVTVKRPVNEYAQLPHIVPGTSDVEDLLK